MTGQPLIEMEGTRLPSLALSPKMTTRESPKVCNAQHGDRWPRRTLVNSDMTLTRGTLKKVGLPLPELIPISQALPSHQPLPLLCHSPRPLPLPSHHCLKPCPPPVSPTFPSFSLGSAHFSDSNLPGLAHLPTPPTFLLFFVLHHPLPRLCPSIVSYLKSSALPWVTLFQNSLPPSQSRPSNHPHP